MQMSLPEAGYSREASYAAEAGPSPEPHHQPMFFPDAGYRADLAACRAMLRGGSKSFFTASLLLPRHVLEPATALYAFCRQADDAIDDPGAPAAPASKQHALARLHRRLDAAYAGDPFDYPADRAFARVVEHTAMPRALPEALLEGFAWDAAGRRYESLDDLYSYAARVAGSVGAMMAVLMGTRAPDALARACDLGIGMQLTNIVRDVGEDARAGRIYLPLSWLREAGIAAADLAAMHVASPALAGIVARLAGTSHALYESGLCGIAALPASCRPGIRAACLLYGEIGRKAERAGFDTVSRRVHVGARRKLALVARSLGPNGGAKRRRNLAPVSLATSQWLVDAASQPAPRDGSHRKALRDQYVWLLDTFEKLDRFHRSGQVSSAGG